jgi:hypothetical protein
MSELTCAQGRAQLANAADRERPYFSFDAESALGRRCFTPFGRGGFPRLAYEGVVPGATFTLREGSRIVGFGRVLARQHAA